MIAALKRIIKPFIPLPVLRRWNASVNRRRNFQLSAAYVFGTIYREKHWGGEGLDFYSGSGSHSPEVVEPYIAAVRSFICEMPRRPVVVDIGCGDFAVGSRLVDLAAAYHACDAVPELVERNRRTYSIPDLAFAVVDAVADPLPLGDVVIVKQVFQHLRNDQIAAIVRKLSQYKTWIICEHVPTGRFKPNIDKLVGGDNRMHLNSGVVLTERPFKVKPRQSLTLCESAKEGGLVRTIAYRF